VEVLANTVPLFAPAGTVQRLENLPVLVAVKRATTLPAKVTLPLARFGKP
jgi:hypothetical protein